MAEDTNASLSGFLLRDPRDEEICFSTWHPAAGRKRLTALLHNPIFPAGEDRTRHGNVSALPRFVDRAKETARVRGAGLAMIHTHPFGKGWQGLSGPDLHYERDLLAREVYGITGLPLVGLTLAGDKTWSARFYPKAAGSVPNLQWAAAVRIVGSRLKFNYNSDLKPSPKPHKAQLRTTSVWGLKLQSDIMRMRVGVIGAGSVGMVVCEILARIGAGELYILDYDTVKTHNLDRLLYATRENLGNLKAELACERADKSATTDSFKCEAHTTASIVEDEGYTLAKDCDVLFSCVDRPWPRQVLNHLAYSCLIPVVDGGVSFKIDKSKLIHGMFRAQTVGPQRVCLNCLGGYDSAEVQLDREGNFTNPRYIAGLKKLGREPSRQNIMPFSMGLASIETIQFVELVTGLGRKGDLGQQAYDYQTGEILPKHETCKTGCEYAALVAHGDNKRPFLSRDISKDRK